MQAPRTGLGERGLARERPHWRRDQQGSTLITTMVVIAFLMLILSAIVGWTASSQRGSLAYRDQRNERFEGDAAVKAAVNWAAGTPDVGRDPAYFTGANADDPCAYVLPSQSGGEDVTVTCAADSGEGSGVPQETGRVPDQALLLLGQRYGETPYHSPCTYSSRTSRQAGEVGLRLNSGRLARSGSNTICQYPGDAGFNSQTPFTINGDVRSNSPVVVDNGWLSVLTPGTTTAGTSPLFDNLACVDNAGGGRIIGTACQQQAVAGGNQAIRANSTQRSPASNPWNPVEVFFTDPGAASSAERDEWRQATINWRSPSVSINGNAPVVFDASTSWSACRGATTDLVRFYPGWYRSAAALNRMFNDSPCRNGVFWFGPAADTSDTVAAELPDVEQARQGTYLFDFRDPNTGSDGSGRACQYYENTNYPHRWCIDASLNEGGPMVVAGWPQAWDPGTIVGSDESGSTTVSLGAAQPDLDGSHTWSTNGADDDASGAASLDNVYARYRPWLTSTNRSLVLRNFANRLNAVVPDGDVTLTVRHREHRSLFLNSPQIVVRTSDRGITYNCGTYTIPKSYDSSPAFGGNGIDQPRTDVISTNPALSTISLSEAQRSSLRDCFINAERVNNLNLRWQATGNYSNITWDGPPNVFLDGIDVTVESPTGGWFPAGRTEDAVYCNPQEPGVQFIFGGDSTVHVGQAALQICAGPAPSNPDDFQQIAVWGQPQNFLSKSGQSTVTRTGKTGRASLVPTSAAQQSYSCSWGDWSCSATQPNIGYVDRGIIPGNPYTDPSSPDSYVTSDYNMGYSWAIWGAGDTRLRGRYSGFGGVRGYGSCSSSTDICLDTSTQRVGRVELKVAYDTNCGTLLSSETDPWCPGAGEVDYTIRNAAGTVEYCSREDRLPPNKTMMWFAIDVTDCFNVGSGDSTTRLNDFRVEIEMECVYCFSNVKRFEGVEIIPTLVPSADTAQVVMPAGGCRLSPSGFGAGVGDANFPANANDSTWYGVYTSNTRSRDCALISGGRVSIHGTVYAPSDALEIADSDSLYPFASRGVVARHLRVKAYQTRRVPPPPAISNQMDRTPDPREATFTACHRSSASTAACGSVSGDSILTRARVRFDVDPGTGQAAVPSFLWWSTER